MSYSFCYQKNGINFLFPLLVFIPTFLLPGFSPSGSPILTTAAQELQKAPWMPQPSATQCSSPVFQQCGTQQSPSFEEVLTYTKLLHQEMNHDFSSSR